MRHYDYYLLFKEETTSLLWLEWFMSHVGLMQLGIST